MVFPSSIYLHLWSGNAGEGFNNEGERDGGLNAVAVVAAAAVERLPHQMLDPVERRAMAPLARPMDRT